MNGDVPTVQDPACYCVHARVFRQTKDDGGAWSEVWKCIDCKREFTLFPLDIKPGSIQVMEPMQTLRDQFAMAAMQADAVQSAIVAAAYIAQGKRFDGDVPNLATATKEHYETADAMLEARKK